MLVFPTPLSHRAGSRFRKPECWLMFVLVGFALTFGGCIQDAHNANKDFNFDNPADPTPTNSSGIVIVGIDYLSSTKTVFIVNQNSSSQDLTSFALINQTKSQTYTFGTFTLGVGGVVRVHPGTLTDTSKDVYSGAEGTATSPTWTLNDIAILQNATGGGISSCTVGNPTC